MARGFMYLAAVVDWYSGRVLAWRLSITLDSAFCTETAEEALSRYGKPDIFNTDQGCQFISEAFTGLPREHRIAISMDGKGRRRDNVFAERWWKTIKYEKVYLKTDGPVSHARQSVSHFTGFHNARRSHSRLDGRPPISCTSNNRCPRSKAA